MIIKQITIFGVGLIGGSLALSLKKANFCQRIVGCGRSEGNLKKAKALGVIDHWEIDPIKAIIGSDLIFLAVPLGAMKPIVEQIKCYLSDEIIITDAGSAKQSVVSAMKEGLGYLPKGFVPGHPIAGGEQSGIEAAIDDLYSQRKVILTPLPETDSNALKIVTQMWEKTDALVEILSVDVHDKVLAATSHLAHILAYQLVDTLNHCEFNDDLFNYTAGGFQDFTRIASSDPVMWRDICVSNRSAILAMINRYQNDLNTLKTLIDQNDEESIYQRFCDAKKARDDFLIKRTEKEGFDG